MQITEPRRYSYFQALWMSFFSGDLYRDVGQRWQGWGGLYLFLITGIYSMIMPSIIVWFGVMLYQGNYEEGKYPSIPVAIDDMLNQLPPMLMQHGKVSTPEAKIYQIYEPYGHNPLITIDTTGKTLTLDDAKTPVLVTANELIYKKDNHEEVYRFKKMQEELAKEGKAGVVQLDTTLKEFSKIGLNWIEEHAVMICIITWLIGLVSLLPLYFAFYAVLALIWYGVIGMLTGKVQNMQLHYLDYVRISCVAQTPLLAFSLFKLLILPNGISWLVGTLVGVVVIVLATLSNKRPA